MALLKGEDGSALQIRVSDGYIQWKLETDSEWKNIIAISELKGADGKNIELQASATYIQWRVVGDSEWINLIALADLKGAKGDDGVTPHIGANKHWYIGDTDTGIVAEGTKGDDGGTPEIGENGNWFINGVDTGKSSKGAKGDDGKSVTSATVGTTSEADGYTVTPVIFGLSNGSSLPAVNIKAKNAAEEIIDFGTQSRHATFSVTSEQMSKMLSDTPPLVRFTIADIEGYKQYVFTLKRNIRYSNRALYGGCYYDGEKAVLVGFDAHGTTASVEVYDDEIGGSGGGTPVIDLGEVTLTEQSLGGISMSMADGITVSAEQATQAQAETPPVVKVKFDGDEYEFCRTKISTDATAVYISFAATKDMGEGTRFYNLQITVSLIGGGASAMLLVWKYGILQGLNNAYEAGGLTFENGVATKTLSEEEASLFGGEGVYNQIRFWDTNASNELYILYASHNNRGVSPINSHKCDYFGIVENASVTGEGGGITAFAAYLDDTTLTIKQINLGGGGGAGGGLTVTEVEYTSGQYFSAVLNSLPAEFWSKRIISVQNSGQDPCLVIEGSGQSWSSDFCGMCFNVGNTKFTMMTYAMQQPDETNIFSYPVHISGVRELESWGASVIPLGLTMADSEPIMNTGIKMSGNGKFVFYTQEA